jgi:RNA polymerase sigma-70 factor (ECF subfamily)
VNLQQALAIIDTLARELEQYPHLHSTRGELLARIGRTDEARVAFERALALAPTEPDRRLLMRKLREL